MSIELVLNPQQIELVNPDDGVVLDLTPTAVELVIGGAPTYTTTDGDAIHDNVAGEIAAIVSKGSPTGSDLLLIEDAADSNNKKKITIATLPTGAAVEVNDLTAAVTWANIPDVNVPETAVTQHEAALSITESQISDLSHVTVSDDAYGVGWNGDTTGAASRNALYDKIETLGGGGGSSNWSVASNIMQPAVNGDGVLIDVPTVSRSALVLKTTDDSATNDIFEIRASSGSVLSGTQADGIPFAHGGEADSNTMFGIGAGNAPTMSGTNNTLYGKNTGAALTTGSNNVFFGFDVGKLVTTGGSNTIIGANAGSKYTGSNAVLYGLQAGRDLTTGFDNTFLGANAGVKTKTGGNNIAIGANALNQNTSGSNIVAIGARAGTFVTGSGGVFLGNDAGYSETSGNRLYISNTSTTTPLIYGEFDNSILATPGKFGIATKAPTYTLSLGGNSARTFWMERHTTSNTAGNALTVQAGGATASATDKAGGSLILAPGTSTGSGESGVQIQGSVAGASGTADRAPATQLEILGNKFALFGSTPVIQQNGTGETTGFVAGSGTGVNDDSTFTGNVGSTAYRISDVVKALKNYGLLAA